MRTVQLMSMMKLMLPPVVSSGQYQIMESRIAMVEHIAMTDRAMTGPQWHNRRTSWRFSNVTKVDRKFIFFHTKTVIKFRLQCSWNILTRLQYVTFVYYYLAKSWVQTMHIFFLVFCLPGNLHVLKSLSLSVSHCSWPWQRAASSLASLGCTLSLWQTQILHLWEKHPEKNTAWHRCLF